MKEKRDEIIILRLTKTEKNRIYEKMFSMGIRSLSAYIRKMALDGLKKLPKAKDLSIEYAELLKKKKEAYPDYRKARDEMQELMKAQKNVEMFFAEEKSTTEKEQAR